MILRILGNCNTIEITLEQEKKLLLNVLITYCCVCKVYHEQLGATWEQIEEILDND